MVAAFIMRTLLLRFVMDVTLVFSAKEARELARKDTDAVQGDAVAGILLQERAATATRFTIDGQAVAAGEAVCDFDGEGNATLRFRVKNAPRCTLEIQSRWLAMLPLGHRQFVSIVKEPSTVLSEQLLSATSDSAIVELAVNGAESAATKPTGTWPEFVGLGLKHILIGFDHLLFLFSLVIVSRRLVPTVQLITCFTVAHSVTLALATFDLVRIPARVVEPLIAASILFVAVENLVRRDVPKSRPWLVFGFGLIHGLGFASVLRELGVGASPSSVHAAAGVQSRRRTGTIADGRVGGAVAVLGWAKRVSRKARACGIRLDRVRVRSGWLRDCSRTPEQMP